MSRPLMHPTLASEKDKDCCICTSLGKRSSVCSKCLKDISIAMDKREELRKKTEAMLSERLSKITGTKRKKAFQPQQKFLRRKEIKKVNEQAFLKNYFEKYGVKIEDIEKYCKGKQITLENFISNLKSSIKKIDNYEYKHEIFFFRNAGVSPLELLQLFQRHINDQVFLHNFCSQYEVKMEDIENYCNKEQITLEIFTPDLKSNIEKLESYSAELGVKIGIKYIKQLFNCYNKDSLSLKCKENFQKCLDDYLENLKKCTQKSKVTVKRIPIESDGKRLKRKINELHTDSPHNKEISISLYSSRVINNCKRSKQELNEKSDQSLQEDKQSSGKFDEREQNKRKPEDFGKQLHVEEKTLSLTNYESQTSDFTSNQTYQIESFHYIDPIGSCPISFVYEENPSATDSSDDKSEKSNTNEKLLSSNDKSAKSNTNEKLLSSDDRSGKSNTNEKLLRSDISVTDEVISAFSNLNFDERKKRKGCHCRNKERRQHNINTLKNIKNYELSDTTSHKTSSVICKNDIKDNVLSTIISDDQTGGNLQKEKKSGDFNIDSALRKTASINLTFLRHDFNVSENEKNDILSSTCIPTCNTLSSIPIENGVTDDLPSNDLSNKDNASKRHRVSQNIKHDNVLSKSTSDITASSILLDNNSEREIKADDFKEDNELSNKHKASEKHPGFNINASENIKTDNLLLINNNSDITACTPFSVSTENHIEDSEASTIISYYQSDRQKKRKSKKFNKNKALSIKDIEIYSKCFFNAVALNSNVTVSVLCAGNQSFSVNEVKVSAERNNSKLISNFISDRNEKTFEKFYEFVFNFKKPKFNRKFPCSKIAYSVIPGDLAGQSKGLPRIIYRSEISIFIDEKKMPSIKDCIDILRKNWNERKEFLDNAIEKRLHKESDLRISADTPQDKRVCEGGLPFKSQEERRSGLLRHFEREKSEVLDQEIKQKQEVIKQKIKFTTTHPLILTLRNDESCSPNRQSMTVVTGTVSEGRNQNHLKDEKFDNTVKEKEGIMEAFVSKEEEILDAFDGFFLWETPPSDDISVNVALDGHDYSKTFQDNSTYQNFETLLDNSTYQNFLTTSLDNSTYQNFQTTSMDNSTYQNFQTTSLGDYTYQNFQTTSLGDYTYQNFPTTSLGNSTYQNFPTTSLGDSTYQNFPTTSLGDSTYQNFQTTSLGNSTYQNFQTTSLDSDRFFCLSDSTPCNSGMTNFNPGTFDADNFPVDFLDFNMDDFL